MNQEVPSAVARQCGFVVSPSFAGITVQVSCGSLSWCFVPYLSVGLRNEPMLAYRFAAITAIKTAFLIKSKISEIQSSQQTQHQHKQNRYSLYRSLDSSIVLRYPDVQTE